LIELHLVLKVAPGKTRIVIDALQALAKNARATPGCQGVEVYKSVDDQGGVCYDEIWGSESELRSMITSKHFTQLAALMELSSEPPNCQFRFISKTQGLEFAEQIKGYTPH
jgi:quinol monooxygenase YgiN